MVDEENGVTPEEEPLTEEEIMKLDREARRRLLLSCTCGRDPYADLPPEERPPAASSHRGLRKVVCPGCGKTYWTNRDGDYCFDCEPKRSPG